MLEDPIAIGLLLITGIVALLLTLLLFKKFLELKRLNHLFWAISFLVLFISGVLIILLGFEVLEEDLVPVVAALIPVCLAIGLYNVEWADKKYWLYYTIYSVVLIVLLTLARTDIFLPDMKTMILLLTHIPAGLSIVIIPLYTAFVSKSTEWTSVFFSIGGLLISIGGVLLAFLKVESLTPILSQAEIFGILPLLLLIVSVFFVLGIGLPSKWKIDIPFL